MYIVIAYKNLNIESESLPVYLDNTEKYFSSIEDAQLYRNFLLLKYPNLDICISNIVIENSIDINELKIKDALSKLSEEEKQLLGL